jgi:hypothetical protein
VLSLGQAASINVSGPLWGPTANPRALHVDLYLTVTRRCDHAITEKTFIARNGVTKQSLFGRTGLLPVIPMDTRDACPTK